MKCLNRIKKKTETVPCGSCLACLKNRRMDWSFRVNEEMKRAKSAHFLTLTYDNDHVPYHYRLKEVPEAKTYKSVKPTLNKSDIQKFLKRLRKKQGEIIGEYHQKGDRSLDAFKNVKIVYFAVGEYGETYNRPHYHLIIFNLIKPIVPQLRDIWKNGIVDIGKVTPKSINYVTAYVTTLGMHPKGTLRPFAQMSKGIGENYVERMKDYHKSNKKFTVLNSQGLDQRMPRYLKEKIFSYHDRYMEAVEKRNEEDKRQFEREKFWHENNINGYEIEAIEKRQQEEKLKKSLIKKRKL